MPKKSKNPLIPTTTSIPNWGIRYLVVIAALALTIVLFYYFTKAFA